MRKQFVGAWIVALLLTACVAHEKAGDKAAALGDWRAAYQQYSAALANEPDSAVLKEKFNNAKRQAIDDAYRKAQACAASNNWSCAVGESDFALQLDGGNMEISSFRANAAKNLALAHVSQARDEAERGKFRFSLELIERARGLSNDPSVTQAVEQARPGLATMADAEAERLRQRKAYPEAVEALSVAASIDSSKQGKLDALNREYEAWRAAEYERLALEGDQALAQRNWGGAEERYVAALKMRPGGRAEPLARYASGMGLAESGMSRRDFAAAAAGYRQAVDSGQDTSGHAAQQLALVEVRPYTVRIHSVLARPVRPDGQPWVGRMNPALSRMLSMLEHAGPRRGSTSRRAIDAALSLPPENRPSLSVRVTLPDGTRLATPVQNGLYVVYDSEFVVMTNAFDERRLRLNVTHGNGQFYDDVGMVEFPLGEIVQRREANLSAQSIAGLDLAITPAMGKTDGMFANMFPLYDGTNVAQDYSVPTPNSIGYRLRSIRVAIPAQALAMEPDEGAGELVVEIHQAGRVVYRSPQLDNLYEGHWNASNINLFVHPGEQLRVIVWDMDPHDADILVDSIVTAEALSQGTVGLSSPNGSSASIQVEPRHVWAGGITP
ncbi:hypothetical protein [Hyalangium rubrum]|uniref:Lipoprotein n=1 Tax=Hyalangium rubrum TaxID=3103134 RepID=A0ABU5H979_9BACT|nr:hypothetical protein [Hyalangium sp. s54d21]MDY7229801.1 hypothetical protein [Hyalangium sp. s54d21]